MTCTEPPPFALLQLAPLPAGSVEVRMSPLAFPLAQRSAATQLTPSRLAVPPGVPASFQVEAPPLGSVETKIRPPVATATQSEGLAQETLRRSGRAGELGRLPVAGGRFARD